MIYLISNNKQLFDSEIYQISTLEESINYLIELNVLSVDTETTGLDCHTNEIFLLQIGNKERQYIIDTFSVDIKLYKDILESKLLILQNAKFDLQFLFKHNIIPTNIYDTMLAEQVLTNGLNTPANLEYLVQKYCNKEISKQIQKTISQAIINDSVIKYSANDIIYLSDIKELQVLDAIKKNVSIAIKLENQFVVALAYSEYCGMYLDRQKWINKYTSAKELLIEKTKLLNEYVIKNNYTKYIDKQLDLFSTEPKVSIKWSSSKQVAPLFKDVGINVKADNITGESISEPILVKQKDNFEIIPIFLEYQTIRKDFNTYGEKFLKHINPKTNRIHTNFNQLMNTGRLSSNSPNMQNVPSDQRTRSCFVPQLKDNVLIDADYSAQEDILFVNYSQEKKMIEFYQGDFSDGHSYVAKLCFPKELKDIELKDIKKERPNLRFLAKSAKFAIHYSGTGKTISENLNLPIERGKEIYNAYLKAFPDINKYLNKVKQDALKNGYILLSPVTKRKYWRNSKDEDYSFSKLACNYPIQASGAETIKIAAIKFFRYILENNYFNIVKISGFIHDEILVECPKDISEEVANTLKECMEEAGKYFCKTIPLKAVPSISTEWEH